MKAKIKIVIAVLALLLAAGALGVSTMRLMRPDARARIGRLLPMPEPTPAPTPAATPAPTPMPTPAPTPALRKRTELLTLVNPWHKLPDAYEPAELRQVTYGYDEEQFMDARAADALYQMVFDCAEAGNDPYVCSAYRSREKQENLFNNKLYRLVYVEGADEEAAARIAAESVAVPGTSEHQLGLAADIIDYNYPNLDEQQENSPTSKWLIEHCWDYGFILRYPVDKSDVTGIIYEPWHYRYVGVEAAKEMHALGLTLEEYLDRFYEPLE